MRELVGIDQFETMGEKSVDSFGQKFLRLGHLVQQIPSRPVHQHSNRQSERIGARFVHVLLTHAGQVVQLDNVIVFVCKPNKCSAILARIREKVTFKQPISVTFFGCIAFQKRQNILRHIPNQFGAKRRTWQIGKVFSFQNFIPLKIQWVINQHFGIKIFSNLHNPVQVIAHNDFRYSAH